MIVINSRPKHIRSISSGHSSLIYYTTGMLSGQLTTCTQGWHIPTDIYETDDDIVVNVEIPGMDEEDFQIYAEPGTLSISGIKHDSCESMRAYHQMEIRYGEFFLNIDLPSTVQVDLVTARYHNGLLQVTLPKQPSQ